MVEELTKRLQALEKKINESKVQKAKLEQKKDQFKEDRAKIVTELEALGTNDKDVFQEVTNLATDADEELSAGEESLK